MKILSKQMEMETENNIQIMTILILTD